MQFNELKQLIVVGLQFKKPNVQSSIVKVDSEGFYYSIGTDGNSKKITYDVFEQCYIQLQTKTELSRKFFNETFPSIARTSPCNYTTIGGLFQHFNLVTYERPTYKRVCKK